MVRWALERRLVLACGLAAALPIVIGTVRLLANGWFPLADDGLITTRALDVFTAHSPLVGQFSSGPSNVLGVSVFNLGPLLFWLLALPARLPWPGFLLVTIGLVNVASVMGIVALAKRRGGEPLMFAAAAGLLLAMASVPPETFTDIWNPVAPLLPLTLLIFLSWSLCVGEYRLLPLTVLVASFVAQTYLTFVLPVLGVLAVGLLGLTFPRTVLRARPHTSARRQSMRRWVVAALLVAVACWTPVLIDQAIHGPGNLVLLVRAATHGEPTLGLNIGAHALVRAVGIVPWWLRHPQVPAERIADLNTAPGVVSIASTVLVMAALVAATLIGRRRRRADLAAAGLLGLILCLALVLVTASTPRNSFDTLGYGLRWASPAGMFVWLAVGWSLATIVRPVIAAMTAPRRAIASLAALLCVAGIGGLIAAKEAFRNDPYKTMHAIADRVNAAVPTRGVTRVDVPAGLAAPYLAVSIQQGIVYALRHDGRDVIAPTIAPVLGAHYGSRPYAHAVRVGVNQQPAPAGQTIFRANVPQYADPGDPFAPKHAPINTVAITLASPAGGR